ncbi:MAG: hypothetical protein KAZ21_02355 [Comamonas sp.]|nr:hypothetical protein [Comamonas sp.]
MNMQDFCNNYQRKRKFGDFLNFSRILRNFFSQTFRTHVALRQTKCYIAALCRCPALSIFTFGSLSLADERQALAHPRTTLPNNRRS